MTLRQICLASLAVCLGACPAESANAQAPAFRTSQAETNPHAGRRHENFDAGWRFLKGDPEDAQTVTFDDSHWRTLDLPHDWSIEGPYDKSAPSGAPCGYLPCGIGWYRKTFRAGPECQGKKVFIQFDGIYMNSDVWINGHHLGKRPYGYIGFQYDLTPYLNTDQNNVLAVRADNSLQPSSRWYTGSGIYRHVWLTVTTPVHVGYQGTYVHTPEISTDRAGVIVETHVQNDNDAPVTVTLASTIVDSHGKRVASKATEFDMAGAASFDCRQSLEISRPQLWSTKRPTLYTLRTEVRTGDETVDTYDTPFGVRQIHFDADKGFSLNGQAVILKGMCNHHDLGPLGAALWDQALERRLRQLKAMGCNSIRVAHNPSSPELLDMCDRLGLLVVNETFDEWREGWKFEDGRLVCGTGQRGKARQGYHLYFDEWAEKDLTDHLVRDRNHPCVIMWSIGNEVPEAQVHGDLDTLKVLRDICHGIDPTRPVTVGCNQMSGVNETGFADLLDTVGYNGGGGSCFQYAEDHAQYPNRIFYASEVPHTYQTRSEYRTHSNYRDPSHQPPNLTEQEVFPETHPKYHSSYDNAGVRISARDSWRLTRDLPYVAGEYRWTGFDYLGESGGWPRVIGNFGIIDIANFPKDTYYFYQSQWTESPMVHVLPHWTWPGKEGTVIPVWAYTNCDSVELFLNGTSLGTRTFTPESDMHLSWDVPYEPGELKAVARTSGQVVCTSVTHTAGEPARVLLSADQERLRAGRPDLSYVTIKILDKEGHFDATADIPVTLDLRGPGRILGIGNGDPLNSEGYQGQSIKSFNGLCLAIIGSTDEPGDIVLTAKSEGLAAGTVKLRSVVQKETAAVTSAAASNIQQQRILESRQIVSAFKTEFTAPPKRTPGKTSVDGPLLGNGDMGVVLAGSPDEQRFILCKNDMWRLQHGYGNASPVPFGRLSLSLPGLKGASYRVVQDLYTATTEGVFELDSAAVTMKSYVAAVDNVFVVELTARGKAFEGLASMEVALGRGSDSESFAQGTLSWGRRAFTKDVDIPSGVAAAWTVFDSNTAPVGESFVLRPGKTVTLVLAMDSLFKHRDYVGEVKTQIRSIDRKRLSDIKAAHEQWWADYYAKSYVSIHDPVIEKQYYLSLYGMGSCSRDPNFPPPIFGWTTQDNPAWHGDYHLNYNHMAPFYGMARANRLEQADTHDAPVLDFMSRAQWHCKEIFGFDGVMYPVGIGPKGIESTYGNPGYIKRGPVCAENGGLFFGQRTNAAYALVNMAPRWYTTYDHDYGQKIYPLVLKIATFWEHYVVWDETHKRFIIDKDSVHEGSGQDLNSCLSLGLVRNALLLALDMSRELEIDADRRDNWHHILKHLSTYTFQEK